MKSQPKKIYKRPDLKVHGSIADLTKGQGLSGDTDQFWILCFHFEWGENPFPGNAVS